MNNLTMKLETYNGWDLPYAKTVHVTLADNEYVNETGLAEFILPNNYTLGCSINAFMGIIFTGRPMPSKE